jgi:pantoate--beta-alanine ligase
MTQQFALPIAIEAGETSRAEDGLALSSRNGYLGAAEREEAIALSRSLRALADAALQGAKPIAQMEADAMAALAARGWQPDYLTVRRRADLLPPGAGDAPGSLVALGAARLGQTRLIDNLEF